VITGSCQVTIFWWFSKVAFPAGGLTVLCTLMCLLFLCFVLFIVSVFLFALNKWMPCLWYSKGSQAWFFVSSQKAGAGGVWSCVGSHAVTLDRANLVAPLERRCLTLAICTGWLEGLVYVGEGAPWVATAFPDGPDGPAATGFVREAKSVECLWDGGMVVLVAQSN